MLSIFMWCRLNYSLSRQQWWFISCSAEIKRKFNFEGISHFRIESVYIVTSEKVIWLVLTLNQVLIISYYLVMLKAFARNLLARKLRAKHGEGGNYISVSFFLKMPWKKPSKTKRNFTLFFLSSSFQRLGSKMNTQYSSWG